MSAFNGYRVEVVDSREEYHKGERDALTAFHEASRAETLLTVNLYGLEPGGDTEAEPVLILTSEVQE